jgi:hypothetical protein
MTERWTASQLLQFQLGNDPTAAQMQALPSKVKRKDNEGPIHVAILEYLELVLPVWAVIHHSPNEMNLKADAKTKAIAQARAKRMGMRPGWPDLEFVLDGRVYFLEVKAPDGVQSFDQEAVEIALLNAGAPYEIVRSIADTKRALQKWRLM